MEEREDFVELIKINKYRLDEECISQSNLYYTYAEKAQEAKNYVSKCDDYLKLVLSDAQLVVRKKFNDTGVKFTEAVVGAEVERLASVREAREELRKAQDLYGKSMIAVQAIENKRSELDNLVKLYCAGYFSTVDKKGGSEKEIRNDIRRNLNKEGE